MAPLLRALCFLAALVSLDARPWSPRVPWQLPISLQGGSSAISLPADQVEKNHQAHAAEIEANLKDESYHHGPCDTLSQGLLETTGYSVGENFVLPDFDRDFRESQGNEWVQVTSKPLLTSDECDKIIQLAEDYFQDGKWGSLPSGRFQIAGSWIKDIPPVRDYFNTLLKAKLFPALAQLFPHVVPDPSLLCVQSAYLFKYTPESGEKTDMHMDSSLLSFTILLNDDADFQGGGTFFECLGEAGEVVEMHKGDVTFRPAGIRHRGQPITKGERYVIGCFVTIKGKQGCEHTRQLLSRGTTALANGDTATAKLLFELARDYNPQFSEIYMSVAHCLRKFGDNHGALKSYQTAFDANPRNADSAFMVGVMHGELGNDDKAMEWYKKAAALNEYDGDAWYRQGLILGRRGDVNGERQMYEKTIQVQPNHVDAHCNLGVVYGEAGDANGEIACLERALELEPDNKDALNNARAAYYHKGVAEYQRGELDSSLACFKRILDRIAPGDPVVTEIYQSVLQRKELIEAQKKQAQKPAASSSQ